MAIDDLRFCSSCLICAKLCVHPKARLKLNDCNLPDTPAESSLRKTQAEKTSVNRKQILSFTKCVSKFCELFNVPPDDDFARDFSDSFKFATLSSKCPVCEDCQNRIRLISKVMLQIENLQAQLATLKKSVENDLASKNLPSPHRSDDYTRNEVNKRFIVDIHATAKVFREQLRRKLHIPLTAENPVRIDDKADAVTSDPNGYPILLQDADFETHENDNGVNLYCDDEYFDIKLDPDHGEDLNDSVDDAMDFCDEKPEWENESELDVDTQNEIRDGTNIYASVEIKGATCTLTLSNLEEPVVIDNSLNEEDFDEMQNFRKECSTSQPQTQATFSAEEFTFDNSMVLTNRVNRPAGARSKSLKMYKKGSISDKRKILKCTFVDPDKGKCRVKVLDQDRMNAHINRFHKHIPENAAYECSLCPFATGSMKRLNLHREQHAGNTDSVQVSVSKTNRKSTSQARPDSDSSLKANKSDSSIRNGRSPGVKRHKPRQKCTRDTSNLLKCTHVDPVKGQCFWKFLDQDRLDAHIRRIHQKIPEIKPFKCNVCPYATGFIKNFTLHKKRHAGIKDVTCEICGMSFRKKDYLLRHKRSKHDEPYPFHCNICEKGCNDSHELKMHNYQNHGEGEFTHRCSVCQEGFYTLPHLRKHMATHAERTFKCDECPKAYQKKCQLQFHMLTHTGVKPFACDLCDWKFYTPQKLNLHRSIHTKKRPFLCQQCGFSCRLPGLLKSHLQVHATNHSLAEQGIQKQPRLAKLRNRRIKIYENSVPLSLPTAVQTSAETSPPEILTQEIESESEITKE